MTASGHYCLFIFLSGFFSSFWCLMAEISWYCWKLLRQVYILSVESNILLFFDLIVANGKINIRKKQVVYHKNCSFTFWSWSRMSVISTEMLLFVGNYYHFEDIFKGKSQEDIGNMYKFSFFTYDLDSDKSIIYLIPDIIFMEIFSNTIQNFIKTFKNLDILATYWHGNVIDLI